MISERRQSGEVYNQATWRRIGRSRRKSYWNMPPAVGLEPVEVGAVGASPPQCPTSPSGSCLKNRKENNNMELDMANAGSTSQQI